jgi:tyrosine-protein kinase Etk/Wzc
LDDRINLIEILRTLVVNRRFILMCTAFAFVVSFAVSLVLPKWYKARAAILPPDAASAQTDIAGIMRFAGYQPAFIPTIASPSDIYAAILESVRIKNAVIDSVNLESVYGARNKAAARKELSKRCKVSVTPAGLIEVRCEDRDSTRVAEITNSFVHGLDRFNRYTLVTSARAVREFIETRMDDTIDELTKAEDALREFKDRTGAVLISEQTEASIQTAAEIYGMIAELEVKRERLSQFATEKSPEIVDINHQIRALERKLAEMGYSESQVETEGNTRLFPKFNKAAGLEQELADLMREVEIKRRVYVVLSEQYEEARVREMRDMPTVQVLDWAEVPGGPSRPRKKTIVAVSSICGFLLSSLYVMARTGRRGGRGESPRGAPLDIGASVRKDLRGLRGFFGERPEGS